MSTPNSGHPALPFTVSTPFRPVRLLEVPEELLSTMTNDTSAKLKFKSAPPALSSGKEGVLHLCVAEKAWAVKQVSTSNSVYLIQPTRTVSPDEDTEMSDQDTDARGVTAVSQVGHFLELHPVKFESGFVERSILDLLPVYHPQTAEEDVDLDLLAANESKSPLSLPQLIDDVAAPDSLVQTICARLGVFESPITAATGVHQRCMIPSTRALLGTWARLIESCAIEGIKLDGPLNPVRITNAPPNETDSAIVERMFESDGTFDALGLLSPEHNLKPHETCRFVAGLLLSAQKSKGMDVNEFTTKWTDLVPASFVKCCTVDGLTSSPGSMFEVSSTGVAEIISWRGGSSERNSDVVFASAIAPDVKKVAGAAGNITDVRDGPAGGAVAGSTTAAADKKRKWHEKFGAQRSVARK